MVYLFRIQGQKKPQQMKNEGSTQVLPETTWASDPVPAGIPPEGSVVVTITRQFGCGGAEIGRMVAETGELRYVNQEIIDEVAKRLGVPVQEAARQDERTAGNVGYVLEAMQSNNPFNINYGKLLNPTKVELANPSKSLEYAYLRLTQRVVLEMASQGNVVIVGRGSQFLLHNSPRTLHIYIFAPLHFRIENVMKHFQLDREAASQLIEQRDFDHDAYLRRYYGSDGRQPNLYHLLINTGLFPYELAASLIHQALNVAKEINR